MKKLLIASIISIAFLSSCTAECDTSKAQGAASCLCELMDQMLLASDDKQKVQDLLEKKVLTCRKSKKHMLMENILKMN